MTKGAECGAAFGDDRIVLVRKLFTRNNVFFFYCISSKQWILKCGSGLSCPMKQARWLLCPGSWIIIEHWPALGLERLQINRGSAQPLASLGSSRKHISFGSLTEDMLYEKELVSWVWLVEELSKKEKSKESMYFSLKRAVLPPPPMSNRSVMLMCYNEAPPENNDKEYMVCF